MNIQLETMRENDPLPPVLATSLEQEQEQVEELEEEKKGEEDGEREAAPTKKKRRSTTKKKRLSRNKSLDLSCPIMTMNKPGNVIRNKEKKWLKNKAIPPSPDSKAMRASFTAMSLVSAGKDDEDNNDDHLMSKSSPDFDYRGDDDLASKLVSASDPCLTVEEGGGDEQQ